jgi:hypothetical protein
MKTLLLLLSPFLWTGASPGKIRLPLARDAIKAANKEVAAAIFQAKNRAQVMARSVPRSLGGELPPDALNSILANAANLSGGKGPLTILPARVVNPSQVGAYEKNPNLALRKPNFGRHQRRAHRSLNTPFMNPGPGYMDIGSNGYSPLSFAMMRPDAASMSPFVPRNTPPPPIRIQLQDPLQDNYKRLILSESEKKVNEMEVQHLQSTLISTLGKLTEKFQAAGSFLQDALGSIATKALDADEKRRSNAESVRNMEAQVEKMKADLVHENTAKQIAKLIGGVVAGNKEGPLAGTKEATLTANKEATLTGKKELLPVNSQKKEETVLSKPTTLHQTTEHKEVKEDSNLLKETTKPIQDKQDKQEELKKTDLIDKDEKR